MKIIERIESYAAELGKPGGPQLAQRIQSEAVNAVLNGIDSPEWKTYMSNFHSNQEQLQRLIGKDTAFMQTPRGPLILAYIAGNGNCGGGTTIATGRDLSADMKKQLDDGLSSDTASDNEAPGSATAPNKSQPTAPESGAPDDGEAS